MITSVAAAAVTLSPRDASVADSATSDQVLHPVMWMFIAILVTFLITRGITRWIRSGNSKGVGNMSVGGVHLHHQVFGILLIIGAGIALVAATPEGVALNVVAVIFGVGISLTLDEFALWFYLEDVYWHEQGRRSVDAIFCVLAVTGVCIGGVDFLSGRPGSSSWWWSVAALAFTLFVALVCLLKGKVLSGLIGIFFIPVGIVAAIRVAKPQSLWARRRYATRPRRAQRSAKRFGPSYDARWNRLRDLVAGAPTAVTSQPSQTVDSAAGPLAAASNGAGSAQGLPLSRVAAATAEPSPVQSSAGAAGR
jgi:hypothetical protein